MEEQRSSPGAWQEPSVLPIDAEVRTEREARAAAARLAGVQAADR